MGIICEQKIFLFINFVNCNNDLASSVKTPDYEFAQREIENYYFSKGYFIKTLSCIEMNNTSGVIALFQNLYQVWVLIYFINQKTKCDFINIRRN